MICFCGVCIPTEVILVTLALFLKPIYKFFCDLLGIKTEGSDDNNKANKKLNNSDVSDSTSASKTKEEGVRADIDIDSHTLADSKMKVDEITANSKYSVVRFTSKTCGPCKAMEPAFFAIVNKYENPANCNSSSINNNDEDDDSDEDIPEYTNLFKDLTTGDFVGYNLATDASSGCLTMNFTPNDIAENGKNASHKSLKDGKSKEKTTSSKVTDNKESHADVKFVSVDIDANSDVMNMFVKDFGGFGVPLFVFMKGGKEVSRFKGHESEQLNVHVSNLINE